MKKGLITILMFLSSQSFAQGWQEVLTCQSEQIYSVGVSLYWTGTGYVALARDNYLTSVYSDQEKGLSCSTRLHALICVGHWTYKNAPARINIIGNLNGRSSAVFRRLLSGDLVQLPCTPYRK